MRQSQKASPPLKRVCKNKDASGTITKGYKVLNNKLEQASFRAEGLRMAFC